MFCFNFGKVKVFFLILSVCRQCVPPHSIRRALRQGQWWEQPPPLPKSVGSGHRLRGCSGDANATHTMILGRQLDHGPASGHKHKNTNWWVEPLGIRLVLHHPTTVINELGTQSSNPQSVSARQCRRQKKELLVSNRWELGWCSITQPQPSTC